MIKDLKIADYVTLLNLVCGSIAIYLSFYEYLMYAAGFIILGAVFDKLDGVIARRLKQESELGADLDSFSDIVTFGLAPTFLMTNLYPSNYIILGISLLLPLFGAMRLARFNVNRTKTKGYFEGVPITTNGIIFPIIYLINPNYIITCLIIILTAFLMISKIKIKKVL